MHVIKRILPGLLATKICLQVLIIALLSLFHCTSERNGDDLPAFQDNEEMENIWTPIQTIVAAKVFSVSYSVGPGTMTDPASRTHKIFAFNGTAWEKIELKQGILEIDSSKHEFSTVEKDVFIRKELTIDEGRNFLQTLIDLKVFSLEEEGELVAKCKGSPISTSMDSPTIFFYIVYDNRVRILSYTDLSQKINDCPNVSEWRNIQRIISLFQDNWYLQSH